MCPDGKRNISFNWRMCGLHTGGKPDSLQRVRFVFVFQVFSKEVRIIQVFRVDIVL